MKLRTHDNRILTLISMGELEKYRTDEGKTEYRAAPSDKLTCLDHNGRRVTISIADVLRWEGSYYFST